MSSDYEEAVDEDWSTQHQTPVPRSTSASLASASKRNKSAAPEDPNTMADGGYTMAESRTPVPRNTSTPLVSASKEKECATPDERNTMIDGGYGVTESRGTTVERGAVVEDSDAIAQDSDAMDIDRPIEASKPIAPTKKVKQPTPKPETPRKSKRALNAAASSLRQEYENAGQPIDLTSSPASSHEVLQLGSEMAGWQGGFTPVHSHPEAPSTKAKSKPKGNKKDKKGTRVRNNFTQEEFDHAPAWLKSRLETGISPAQLEQDYEARFGVLHRYNTLKLWLERQEAKSGLIPTKIVVLKVPIPLHLRESFE